MNYKTNNNEKPDHKDKMNIVNDIAKTIYDINKKYNLNLYFCETKLQFKSDYKDIVNSILFVEKNIMNKDGQQ